MITSASSDDETVPSRDARRCQRGNERGAVLLPLIRLDQTEYENIKEH